MNGPHDLGGQMGFGPVAPETDEPIFHADWEKRALGLTLSSGALGAWNIDESRHARENIPPAAYLGASYYEIWIRALEVLLARHGFVEPEEIDVGRKLAEGRAPARILEAGMVPGVLARGGPCDRPLENAPKFAEGQRCAPATSIPAIIPACRDTPAAEWALSRPCRAHSCFRTTMRMAGARIRNGSIPSCSTVPKSGARTPRPA